MSFGFGVSDFALCVKVAHHIYHALKDASRECEAFAQEVLHLHSLLKTLTEDIRDIDEQLDNDSALGLWDYHSALSEHGARCLQLLCEDIAGEKLRSYDNRVFRDQAYYLEGGSPLETLRRRFSQVKFARKIPRLRRALAGVVSQLNAESVLVVRLKQRKGLQSQARIEDAQSQIMGKIAESQACIEQSNAQNTVSTSVLQDSQSRIENQLQEILNTQHRHSQHLLSGSLNTSSPEGRKTWYELGHLLREEGITPEVIAKNKSILIKSMKQTLDDLAISLQDSTFRTALEYQSFPSLAIQPFVPVRAPDDSMSLYGSAPILGSEIAAASSASFSLESSQHDLKNAENVQDGIEVLLDSLSGAIQTEDSPGHLFDDLTLDDLDDPKVAGFQPRHSGCRDAISESISPCEGCGRQYGWGDIKKRGCDRCDPSIGQKSSSYRTGGGMRLRSLLVPTLPMPKVADPSHRDQSAKGGLAHGKHLAAAWSQEWYCGCSDIDSHCVPTLKAD